MAGKFLRGAFVQFMETFLIPSPNVIVFQFNPEQIVHSWQAAASSSEPGANDNPLAVSGAPAESFSFSLVMDSSDMIADGSPVAEGIADVSGIYTRLAALEMLMHPTGSTARSLVGAVSAAASSASSVLGGAADAIPRTVPASQLPTVLFVWGPGRILPVKINSLSITETLYSPDLLNPTHAEASVGVQVMTPRELQYVSGPLAAVARVAYVYSQGLRETLAAANLANSVESITGMLPV